MSTSLPNPPTSQRMTMVAWLVCIMAAIGFAFDIYELLMLPLIARPALMELVGAAPGTSAFRGWVATLFYVPAVAGGIFGLLGGYLTDRLGRRRVLTWSILLYAVSAFAAGYSTSIWMLLFFRCTTFVGVCVEFVAAVAWLAELFPDAKQREKVLGYTQAFSSIGGLLVASVNDICVGWAKGEPGPLFFGLSLPAMQLPEIYIPQFLMSLAPSGKTFDLHAAWRYTLMSGLIPALPLLVIRPFLPESPAWAAKKAAGTLKRPNILQLFSPEFARTTIVTTIMFACSYGAAFGAIQMIQQIVPGLPEVQQRVKEKHASPEVKAKIEKRLASKEVQALIDKNPAKKQEMLDAERKKVLGAEKGSIEQAVSADVTKKQEIGGLVGRFLIAVLALYIVSRRTLLRIFQIPGMFLMPVIFGWAAITGLNYIYVGMFIAGLLTVAQFSFWGNYLPRVYPLYLRGTGESFAANIGGRLFGTSFAAVTSYMVAPIMPFKAETTQTAVAAAIVGTFVYVVGFGMSFFLPEPKPELMED